MNTVFERVSEKLVKLGKEKNKLSSLEDSILKFCTKPRTSSDIVQLFPGRLALNIWQTLRKFVREGKLLSITNKFVTSVDLRKFEPVMTMTAEVSQKEAADTVDYLRKRVSRNPDDMQAKKDLENWEETLRGFEAGNADSMTQMHELWNQVSGDTRTEYLQLVGISPSYELTTSQFNELPEDIQMKFKELQQSVEGSRKSARMWEIFVNDIDMGGGWKADLFYDTEENMVKEVKTHVDGREVEREFSMEVFDASLYGEAGEEFLELVEVEERKQSEGVEHLGGKSGRTSERNWPDIINFKYFDGYKTYNNTTPEYKELEKLEGEEWENYLNDMASTGVEVDYDHIEDEFRVFSSEYVGSEEAD